VGDVVRSVPQGNARTGCNGKRIQANGFKVIGFNVDDETPEQIKPFAEDMKLNYQLAWADENLYRELLKVSKFNGIPQSFLIDRQGHLRGVFLGGSPKVVKEMRENVEKVVGEM
jgi:peroxiredoxin